MSATIPQTILDALTDIEMPRLTTERPAKETVAARGFSIPVHRSEALVLGSGAAGLRAAVEMKRRDLDVVVVTQSAFGGTSACSGSDKQTLHTANGAGQGDDFAAMADALGAGGAMDEDTAYIEAVGSPRALSSLQFMGLPIPQDRLGGALRYQTDHDEVGPCDELRPPYVAAHGAGAGERGDPAERADLQSYDRRPAPGRTGRAARLRGALAMSVKRRSEDNPLGLAVFSSESVVIATGGPGELYRDSVYPRHCFGSLALAMEAGLEAVNLTESQFGIGTSRDGFPWNLSGTYVQAMPYIFSRDPRGNERNFLADYYRTTQELASNVFRKGYQWPFHSTRMLSFGSSLVDLAIVKETRAGRKVFMDFNRNPLAVPGDAEFTLDRLDPDVRAYLRERWSADGKAARPASQDEPALHRALQALQIRHHARSARIRRLKSAHERRPRRRRLGRDQPRRLLRRRRGGRNARRDPARRGGAQRRPGLRHALRRARGRPPRRARYERPRARLIDEAVARTLDVLKADSALTVKAIRKDVQDRMSDHAGVLCNAADVKQALAAARELNETIRQQGIAYSGAPEALKALQWRQTALLSEAVLTALAFYIGRGGGSRGARAICAPDGDRVPEARIGVLEDVRFVSERAEDRAEQIHVRFDSERFVCEARPIRRRDREDKPFFERDWPDFLTGAIHDPAPKSKG